MTQNTTHEIVAHYFQQVHGIADGLLGRVLEANGLSQHPKLGSELGLIPVYEEGYPATLLSLANNRATTTVTWAQTPQLDYLQAYYKRYRPTGGGPMENKIVVVATNYCWARFYAAKELFHCFMDDDGYPASNSFELVNDLIESLASGGFARPDCGPQTIIDEVAWLGAMLFVAPEAWMPAIHKLQTELEANFRDGNSLLYVAQQIRVPVQVLTHRLRIWSRTQAAANSPAPPTPPTPPAP